MTSVYLTLTIDLKVNLGIEFSIHPLPGEVKHGKATDSIHPPEHAVHRNARYTRREGADHNGSNNTHRRYRDRLFGEPTGDRNKECWQYEEKER